MEIRLICVMVGLFVVSVGYDRFIGYVEGRGHDRGYMAFIVALGVLYTLAGACIIIGWLPALIVLACFAASGTPMIAGSVSRYVNARSIDEQAVAKLAKSILDKVNGNRS